MSFQTALKQYVTANKLPAEALPIIEEYVESYMKAYNKTLHSQEEIEKLLKSHLEQIVEQMKHPYIFETFHQSIRTPIDYYSLGLELVRPLVDFPKSHLYGQEHAAVITKQLDAGDNVILLANHQSEADPQIISILLEKSYPKLGENMIFVAGHRVTTDPFTVPLSKGRNLLCIWSKKHMDNPPELKEQKLLHNQKTMNKMSQLLAEGGKCIYVAPSGGRDRLDEDGTIRIAPFDPQSIEMFSLMARQSGHPTHFYPLALSTYEMQPPPQTVSKTIGERRQVFFTPIQMAFGPEINMSASPQEGITDKKQQRQLRAIQIHDQVLKLYETL